jgi:flagellar hook protein FlgE
MFTSFSTALSALDADTTALSVVGNNLANLNTPGFKASTVYFRDLVTESVGAGLGDTQVGFGTAEPNTICEFTQGAIQTSTGPLDAAIQGNGFFVVQNTAGQTLYTRAGNFSTNAAGQLVTTTGELAQGWTVDPATGRVDTTAATGNIVVPTGSVSPPVVTNTISLSLNLNSAATVTGAPNLSYPIKVYDQLGTAHVVTAAFTKTGTNTWAYTLGVPAADVDQTAAAPSDSVTGTLAFTPTGQLDTTATTPTSVVLNVGPLVDGAPPMAVTWNMLGSDGLPTMTQVAESSAVSGSTQNGSPAAQLTSVGLSDGGVIEAQFSDGTQVEVGQLAMASVRNPDSLVAEGDNNFSATAKTASPVIGMPGTGGNGQIVGGSIEASTVDLATNLTDLIVYQRAYEANSKVVTSVDQLSQDTINLIH